MELGRIIPVISIPIPLGRSPDAVPHLQSQRAAVFVLLFALLMLLIIYSSSSGTEVFPYSALRGRARRPPNLRHWGVSSGYLPVSGNKSLTAHCHQCAIVTSSSHLLGTHLGTEIDQTECTIRMNDAPTTGYEADVGNKTTFRVVAHSSVYRVLRRPQEFVNKTPETILIFWGPPAKMQKGLLKIIQRVGASFPNMTAYIVSPHRMKQFDELFRGETGKDREKSRSWLSTGWFTMGIAVELCDTVHVYGMVPPNYCSIRSPAAWPTTTTSPRAPTSARRTSTTSAAAAAITTASSPRSASLPAGPPPTTSPSLTPPGLRAAALSGEPWGWGPFDSGSF
ncbi:alpha-N-acetylgalactosaminide alpha-2,6-sialyltransferase 6 isoform X1 [Lagopus leucura]|uniref:alpha-N-acetylgalactosaminide alpha-2,6-sialyltransferase 6 isoform X1 n=1 Tax=Lagopus leucura TaxID=30410 RepID=UPI001C682F3A|nr:alpha-N-acetylgalactosaminide alpha-2,6-sialyltransferase 6 isoform X1 [Lagopus leucura]